MSSPDRFYYSLEPDEEVTILKYFDLVVARVQQKPHFAKSIISVALEQLIILKPNFEVVVIEQILRKHNKPVSLLAVPVRFHPQYNSSYFTRIENGQEIDAEYYLSAVVGDIDAIKKRLNDYGIENFEQNINNLKFIGSVKPRPGTDFARSKKADCN